MSCHGQAYTLTEGDSITRWSYSVLQEITGELDALNTQIRTLHAEYTALFLSIHDQMTAPSLEATEIQLLALVDRIETALEGYCHRCSQFSTDRRDEFKELLVKTVMETTQVSDSAAVGIINRRWQTFRTWKRQLMNMCPVLPMRSRIADCVTTQHFLLDPAFNYVDHVQ